MSLDPSLADMTAGRSTMADRIHEELRRAILDLSLRPGTRISEAETARRLGVSRQPVREAFGRLARAGFLRIQPQRATEVMRISPRAVMNAQFLRTALEADIVRRAAAAAGPGLLAVLDDNLSRQDDARAAQDRAAFHRLDDAFHHAIAKGAGCAFAWPLVEAQKAQMDRARFLSLVFGQSEALAEHRRIRDAIAAGDAPAAEAALREHLSRIAGILERLKAEFADVFLDEPAAFGP